MQIEEGIQWVWRDYPGEVFNLAILVLIATTLMSRYFNHQEIKEKLRNTYKFASALAIVWFWSIRLDFLHSQFNRLGIKNVLFASAIILVVAGDWFGFLLFKMATYHNKANLRSGWRGMLADGRDNSVAWLGKTLSAAQEWAKERLSKRTSLAIPLFVLLVGAACISVVITGTPPVVIGPQDQAATQNAIYTDGTATARAMPTPTVTRTATITFTPAPTDTPTATFTSSIFEVTPCPTGEICEIPNE